MTTQGWIFLGLFIIIYIAIHKKWLFKNYKITNWPWYGKVMTIFFSLGIAWAIADLIIEGM